MTLLVNYASKKLCRESIGKRLNYTETSMFGAEYKPDGEITVAYRPHLCGRGGREWFGQITMADGKIKAVR